jgi:hypothetical protein
MDFPRQRLAEAQWKEVSVFANIHNAKHPRSSLIRSVIVSSFSLFL